MFDGVQALRGLAALLVVVLHATEFWTRTVCDYKVPFWGNGTSGVDIFFIISGFVMAVSTIGREHKTHPARAFLGRRLIRVVPLYWLMSFIVIAKLRAVAHLPQFQNTLHHPDTSLRFVLASLFFVPYLNTEGQVMPALAVGWTLNYEMFFYLLFAAALALRVSVARFLTPVMVVLASVAFFRQSTWPALTTLANPLLLEFLGGVLLGKLTLQGFRLPLWLAMSLGVAGLGLLTLIPYPDIPKWRMIAWFLPALALVAAAVSLEEPFGKRLPRWVLLLGNSSYSLYLSHMILFPFLVKILMHVHVLTFGVIRRQDELITIGFFVPLAIFVGLACYQFIEKPMNDFLRRLLLATGRPRVEELEQPHPA